ncbi:MAG: efflux RND transporter periplasmic adaptor subunit [Verrucomicrobiota bacterium]
MRKSTIAIISTALVLGAAATAVILVKTAPEAKKKKPPKMAALVETRKLELTDEAMVLHLTGTVTPSEEVMVRARVGGEVVSMSPDFIDGGLLQKGGEILKIDPVDYDLALAAAEAQLETARFNHKMELGRQDVAQREWELLKTDDASEQEQELALRIPHLAASEAALKAAEANLKKARIDLGRTQVSAPFNAMVLSRNVNIGSQASLQDVLAKLVGTDAFWIMVSIPVDRLDKITIPGSPVNVLSASNKVREGRVIRLLGNLEEKGRMARLLIEVEDPICLQPENSDKKPLLIGEFVRTQITGRELKGVYKIPRKALRENSSIWLARENKLDIRKVEVLWRAAEYVLIRNDIAGGERLIVSDMTTPIQGMDINTGKKKKGEPRNTTAKN